MNSTAELKNLLSEFLQPVLPLHVRQNLSKLAVSGHSPGGKAAFAPSLRKSSSPSLSFSALIGLDLVDGMDKGKQTPPAILTYFPGSSDIGILTMVGGSSLGEVRRNPLFPACAPWGLNHEDFFCECRAPAYYFVANDYRHVDLLDDDTNGVRGKVTYCLCKNGARREPMPRFVGGVVVEFAKAFLGGDCRDLIAIRDGHAKVPLEVQRVEIF